MKDITKYVNEELKPRLYNNIPSIFPNMGYRKVGNKWESQKHIDGTDGTGDKKDRSVITEKYPHRAFDNTRQTSEDIITLFQYQQGYSEKWEAINHLCRIVGIQEPPYTPEGKEYFKKSEEKRLKFEESAERQKKALFSPEGASTLDYLLSRGWTKEEIKEAELGFISTEEAIRIDAQRTIGDYYTLSIPLRSGSRIYGFKFRTIQTDGQKDKYVYLQGTEKRGNLFNLTGIRQKQGEIVVVEGELDALHAQVKGVSGVVATSGGQLTEELLKAALQMGIKRITLLFDKDQRGEEFIKKSINIGYKNRISVMVATFPEETLPDGTKIHDTDEYLKHHSPDELRNIINKAERGGTFLLKGLINEASQKNGGDENLKDSIERDLTRSVISLANSTPDHTERDIILNTYSNYIGNVISKEAIEEEANIERELQEKALQTEETISLTAEAYKLAKDGKTEEALSLLRERTGELQRISKEKEFSSLLLNDTISSIKDSFRERPTGVKTGYSFRTKEGEEEFLLPSGALTYICAPTSHGKSRMLENLALQLATNGEDGATIYFSFEEDESAVKLQLLNMFVDMKLSANNLKSLNSYYKDGTTQYFYDDVKRHYLNEFNRKESEFLSLLTSGKLKVFYKDYDSSELIEAIRYLARQIKVKAVFIDYIQLLHKRGTRLQRKDELKEICKDFMTLAVDTKLPIVLAAQLNREALSPIEMEVQHIGEASDIEHSANVVMLLWNSVVQPRAKSGYYTTKGKEKVLSDEAQKIADRGFDIGTGGKLYATLAKNRGGERNISAVLDFNGNTGRIKPNHKKVEPQQSDLPFDAPTNRGVRF